MLWKQTGTSSKGRWKGWPTSQNSFPGKPRKAPKRRLFLYETCPFCGIKISKIMKESSYKNERQTPGQEKKNQEQNSVKGRKLSCLRQETMTWQLSLLLRRFFFHPYSRKRKPQINLVGTIKGIGISASCKSRSRQGLTLLQPSLRQRSSVCRPFSFESLHTIHNKRGG